MRGVDRAATDLLSRRASTTPDRLALVDADSGLERTFDELSRDVDAVAAGLGVLDADRLGVLLPTGPAFVRTAFAAARTRTTLVPLSTRETPAELAAKAARADVEVVVCAGETEALAAAVAAARPDAAVRSLDAPTRDDVERLPRPGPRSAPDPARLDPDWTRLIGFTSGTSGRPKAVRLTVRNLLASAMASALRLGVDRSDRWLVCLPTYHVGGFAPIVRSALYGTTVVTQRSFEPAETARVVDERDVTALSLVPTMVRRLLEFGWEPPAHLRFVLVGGAPAADALVERALDAGVPIYPTYGTTETASQIATATPAQVERWPGTVGQPLFGTDVTVVGPDGEPADPGETGELVVAGPTVSPGYLDEERAAAAFGDRGFRTGDVGYRDDAGRLWVTGRRSDRIVTGGENVDPEEVRRALLDDEDVEDAAVVGLPDEEWGERVGAAVVAADPASPPPTDEIAARCAPRLAGFKRPRTIRIVERLPRTASDTIDRDAVRELLGE